MPACLPLSLRVSSSVEFGQHGNNALELGLVALTVRLGKSARDLQYVVYRSALQS
jgi:hypothetical protein